MNKLHPFSTISSVVKDLIAHMSIEEQQRIAQLKQDDLIRLHFSWGAKIRNEYGLWDGTNQKLLNSCGTSSPDDASGVIIEQLWRTLRN